jgi:ribosomal protein S24E
MEILKDARNDLLKRREIEAVDNVDSNPGFENSKKNIAEKLKTQEENIVVKNVTGKFGSDDFLINAFIYDSKDEMTKVEPRKKEKKSAAGAAGA